MTKKSLQLVPFKKTTDIANFNNVNALRRQKQALILMQDITNKPTYSLTLSNKCPTSLIRWKSTFGCQA